jgi:adenylate cyclase class IV
MKHTEIETKYSVDASLLVDFKKLVDKLPGAKSFLYVEGEDQYFVNPDLTGVNFARYRVPSHGLDNGRCELTFKFKPEGAKNNIIRKEINWKVSGTPSDAIEAGLEAQGYTFNFSIYKSCHVYKLDGVTLVFYSVYDTTAGKGGEVRSFIEIELCEERLEGMEEAQAWEQLESWEKVFAPLGIKAQNRVRKSLYEIFKR